MAFTLGTPTATKAVPERGKPIEITIRRPTMRKVSDPTTAFLKVMAFGPWSSGKTTMLGGLLEAGERILTITTDLGGSGLAGVEMTLRKDSEKAKLLENLFEIELSGFEQTRDFMENPLSFIPELYTMGITAVAWDGFHFFHQNDVLDYVGQHAGENQKKDPTELRAEGFQLDTLDWNAVKSATMRVLGAYLGMHNKRDGTLWHKLLFCQEDVRQKKKSGASPTEATVYEDVKIPMISGKSLRTTAGGFDVIMRTEVIAAAGDRPRVYRYHFSVDELASCKNRGFELPEHCPADSLWLWNELKRQRGITGVQKDLSLIETNQAADTSNN